MALPERGFAPPEKREGRARLSVRDPLVETVLAGLDLEGLDLDGVRPWSNRLVADARRWLAAGGFSSEHRRLTKADARRALKLELTKLSMVPA
jgi:hypothetical protein